MRGFFFRFFSLSVLGPFFLLSWSFFPPFFSSFFSPCVSVFPRFCVLSLCSPASLSVSSARFPRCGFVVGFGFFRLALCLLRVSAFCFGSFLWSLLLFLVLLRWFPSFVLFCLLLPFVLLCSRLAVCCCCCCCCLLQLCTLVSFFPFRGPTLFPDKAR